MGGGGKLARISALKRTKLTIVLPRLLRLVSGQEDLRAGCEGSHRDPEFDPERPTDEGPRVPRASRRT